MSHVLRRLLVLIFLLVLLLGGLGIVASLAPAAATITSSEPGHRPFLFVVPNADGASLNVKARRLGGFDSRIGSTLRIGPTSSEPGHTDYSPNQDEYTFIYEGVSTPGVTGPQMTALITTTSDGGEQVILGSSDFVREYVPGDANQEVFAQDGQARLLIPSASLPPDSYLVLMNTILPPGDVPPGHRLLGQPYAIRVSGAITQSLAPLLLHIDYDPNLLNGANPHTISLFWWHEGAGRWQDLESQPFGDQATHAVAIRQLSGAYALMLGTTWRDPFLDYSGVAERQNLRLASGGRLNLAPGFDHGYAISQPVSPTTAFAGWDEVRYTAAVPAAATLAVDVLAEDGSLLVENVTAGASLAAIDPTQHPRLRLRARLATTQTGVTPYLDTWSLSWRLQVQPALPLYLPLLMAGEASEESDEAPKGDAPPHRVAALHPASSASGLGCDPPPALPIVWSPFAVLTPASEIAVAPAVQVDSAGRVHAVWYTGSRVVNYASKPDRDADWSAPLGISGATDAYYPDLATDDLGNVYVVWEGGGDIYFATKPAGAGWTAPVNLTRTSQTDAMPAIFADAAGNLHLVWGSDSPGNREILYAFKGRAASDWSAPLRVSNTADRSWAPDVVADSEGGVHVVWYNFTPGVTEIYYAAKAPGAATWGEEIDVSNTAGGSQWPALAIADDDRLHLVWQDTLTLAGQGQALILYYASKAADGDWSAGQEIARSQANGQKAQPPALTISPGGALHVAWAAMTDYRLYYARKPDNEAGWSQPQVVTALIPPPNPANQWYFIGLAADPDRGVHLVWNDMESGATFNQDIKHSAALPPPIPPNHVLALDEEGRAAPGACIYQNGQMAGTTDEMGVFVPASLVVGDRFVALKPVAEQASAPGAPWAYRIGLTSLTIGADGAVSGHTVAAPGRQRLSLHKHTPLIYYNLIISIQWNATPAYVQEMAEAIRRASDYLFDASDGQMVFGQVEIYDDGVKWEEADIQVLTRNNVRPYAYIGGLTSTDPSQVIRVGRHWDGSGGATGSWAERDGYRTLIHEFGHYGLNLYDSYFQYSYDEQHNLTGIDTATGCTMNQHDFEEADDPINASLMTSQYATSEWSAQGAPGLWDRMCEQTYQWQMNEESDWETIRRYYADDSGPQRWFFTGPLSRGAVLAGPEALPPDLLAFPQVDTHDRSPAAPVRQLLVLGRNGRPYAEGALAALDIQRDGRLVVLDQGTTDRDGRIAIYGAGDGATQRVVSIDGAFSAETTISAATSYTLTLKGTGGLTASDAALNPYAVLIPYSDGKDLTLTVAGVGEGGTLAALVRPPGLSLGETIDLDYSPAAGVYTGTASFPVASTGLGAANVRGVSAQPQRFNVDVDFHLARVQTNAEQDLFSPDGDAWLHLDDGGFDLVNVYLLLAPTGAVPEPLPQGMAALGHAYSLTASGALTALARPALLRLFYEPADLPAGIAPSALRIARWEAGRWQPLAGESDPDRFAISARIERLGIYVLLAPDGGESEGRVYLPLLRK